MATRIGVTLDDKIYKEYKRILFNNNKTIQNHLTEIITKYIKEHKEHNAQ